jgi:hypothetical protein
MRNGWIIPAILVFSKLTTVPFIEKGYAIDLIRCREPAFAIFLYFSAEKAFFNFRGPWKGICFLDRTVPKINFLMIGL